MSRLRTGTFLVCLAAVALLARLALVAAVADWRAGPRGPASADPVEFNALALRVAHGDGYVAGDGRPTSFRAPGFPLFLAGVYRAVGQAYPPVYATLCLLGALSCVLTYVLARELVSENEARLAALLGALYVPHMHFATTFLSENLFVPCLALGLWLFIRHVKTGSTPALVAAGLVLGWAALTRPFALLLLPILLGVLLGAALRQRRFRAAEGLAFAVAFLAVLLPWTVRNYRVHGRLVLIATNGGSTFYGANNGRVVGEPRQFGYWVSTTELPHRDLIDATPDEVSHDRMEWRLGLAWLREHPGSVPLLGAFKLARLAYLPGLDAVPGAARWALRVAGYVPFLTLFLLGGVRCLRRRTYWTAPWLAVHGALLATVATALVFWGSDRFRDANMPLLMLYAVVGIGGIVGRWAGGGG